MLYFSLSSSLVVEQCCNRGQGLSTSVLVQMSVDAAHAAVSLFITVSQLALTAFALDFLPNLSLRKYSRHVSRQVRPLGPFHYPPPHLKRPNVRNIQVREESKRR